MEAKSALRKRMRTELSQLDAELCENLTSKLSQNLGIFFKSIDDLGEKVIGGYAPLKGEPEWLGGVEESMAKAFSYPLILDNGTLDFILSYRKNLKPLKSFGKTIMQPPVGEKVVPDLILIPGLAFSEKGERLGRGKGCFDKYLTDYKGLKVGLCFDLQIKPIIPTEENDVKMDVVVTDKRIYKSST